MKRQIISVLLAISLFLSLAPAAFAQTEGLSNFKSVQTYRDGQFTDIPANSWYLENVKSSYELGLVKGASDTTFNPIGNLSIAETIAFASRLHNIYHGGSGKFEQGTPWYKVYVDYAERNYIVLRRYENYDAKATREFFATIMAATLPEEALPAINNIAMGKIPDVPADKAYANAVYRLYNAGILTGNDGYGTFNPDSKIQRCEAAALVTRMADPSLRKTFTLQPKPETDPTPQNCTAEEKAAITDYLWGINWFSIIPPFRNMDEVDPAWVLYTFYNKTPIFSPIITEISKYRLYGTSVEELVRGAKLNLNPNFDFPENFDFNFDFNPFVFQWDAENNRYLWTLSNSDISYYFPIFISATKKNNTYTVDVIDCNHYDSYDENDNSKKYADIDTVGPIDPKINGNGDEYWDLPDYEAYIWNPASYRYTLIKDENGKFYTESKIELEENAIKKYTPKPVITIDEAEKLMRKRFSADGWDTVILTEKSQKGSQVELSFYRIGTVGSSRCDVHINLVTCIAVCDSIYNEHFTLDLKTLM